METTTETRQEKTVQDDLKESAHRIWLAGLGALAAAEQEGTKMFNRLVDRGRDVEAKGRTEAKDQYDKARELDVPVLDEEGLLQLLSDDK